MKNSFKRKKSLISLGLAAMTLASTTVTFDAESVHALTEEPVVTNGSSAPIDSPTGFRFGANYLIHFNTNGGEGYFPTQSIYQGGLICEPVTEPTKYGYTFEGWYIDSALTRPLVFNEYEVWQTGTVYAKWAVARHTVSLNPNGGRVSVSGQVVNHGATTTLGNIIPTRNGHRFTGWYTNSATTIPMDFSQPIVRNTTLYAGWSSPVTLSFNLNGGEGEFPTQSLYTGDNPVEPTTIPTKAGHRFLGWYADQALTTPMDFETWIMENSGTVFAKWEEVTEYTIAFNLNGGEGNFPSQTIIEGGRITLPATEPTKEGYNFVGWYANGNLTIPMDFENFEVNQSGTVFAKWELKEHTLSFNLNGGEGNFPNQTIIDGEKAVAPTTEPTREGYTFAGWYSNAELTTAIDFDTWELTADSTAYAKWTAKTAYTLTFQLNGGTGDFPTQTIYRGENPTAPTTEPTKEGYKFVGWYVDGNLTIPMVFDEWVMNKSGTVFAKWEAKEEFTVTYNLIGGTGDFPSQTILEGGLIPAPTTNPTKTGFTFVGWYTDYNFLNAVDFSTYQVTSNVTLFAKWNRITYTLAFNLNGGQGHFPTQTIFAGGSPSEPTTIPTKDGYTFGGWYVDGNLTIPMVFENWTMEHSGSVFAKWIPVN